jgi:Fe2+ transport system protein FeoA
VDLPAEPDYIELTDDMEDADKRSARIQNSKMRSAYNKQLKEMGIDPKTMQPIGGAPVAAPVAAGAPAAAALDLPPAPDYIELTDEMPDADKRSARIQNSKMRSAYNKQLKEMGIDPKTMQPIGGAPVAAAAPAAAPPIAAPAAPAAPAADLPPPPDYIEISDDMDPADLRNARIQNSKMRSAYNKQLKEMGIDPKTVSG